MSAVDVFRAILIPIRRNVYALGAVVFFHAEDGIRDYKVTGVQTCALPILSPVWTLVMVIVADSMFVSSTSVMLTVEAMATAEPFSAKVGAPVTVRAGASLTLLTVKIGRASCRERVERTGGSVGGNGARRRE